MNNKIKLSIFFFLVAIFWTRKIILWKGADCEYFDNEVLMNSDEEFLNLFIKMFRKLYAIPIYFFFLVVNLFFENWNIFFNKTSNSNQKKYWQEKGLFRIT